MQKKKIISQTQIAQEFLGARGQPLNQLCKNSVQLYQEASLQKKKKHTHTIATIDQLFVPQYYIPETV